MAQESKNENRKQIQSAYGEKFNSLVMFDSGMQMNSSTKMQRSVLIKESRRRRNGRCAENRSTEPIWKDNNYRRQ